MRRGSPISRAGRVLSAAMSAISSSRPDATAARPMPSAVSSPIIPGAARWRTRRPCAPAGAGVVGGDGVDGAVGDPGQQRQRVVARGKRRVDPGSPVVGKRRVQRGLEVVRRGGRLVPGEGAITGHPGIGHGQVVRRHVAGDGQVALLGASHGFQRGGGREVGQVQPRAGLGGQRDVALHHGQLGAGRPAGEPRRVAVGRHASASRLPAAGPRHARSAAGPAAPGRSSARAPCVRMRRRRRHR